MWLWLKKEVIVHKVALVVILGGESGGECAKDDGYVKDGVRKRR